MRIVFTGATGFVGSALVAERRRAGDSCVALVRDVAGARKLLGDDVEVVDIAGGDLAAVLEGSDAVINLAGAPVVGKRWSERYKQVLRDSRVGVTQALVDALEKSSRRPSLLISASAIGYYGDRGADEVSEADPPGDDFLAKLCVEWEQQALRAEPLGVRVCLLRIGLVVGPGGGFLEPLAKLFRFGAGGPVGSGDQFMPWVDRRDLLRLVGTALADDRFRGPFNITGPAPVTNRAFSRALGSSLGRPSLLRAPAFAIKAALGESSEAMLASYRVLPERSRELGFEFRHTDLSESLGHALS